MLQLRTNLPNCRGVAFVELQCEFVIGKGPALPVHPSWEVVRDVQHFAATGAAGATAGAAPVRAREQLLCLLMNTSQRVALCCVRLIAI